MLAACWRSSCGSCYQLAALWSQRRGVCTSRSSPRTLCEVRAVMASQACKPHARQPRTCCARPHRAAQGRAGCGVVLVLPGLTWSDRVLAAQGNESSCERAGTAWAWHGALCRRRATRHGGRRHARRLHRQGDRLVRHALLPPQRGRHQQLHQEPHGHAGHQPGAQPGPHTPVDALQHGAQQRLRGGHHQLQDRCDVVLWRRPHTGKNADGCLRWCMLHTIA